MSNLILSRKLGEVIVIHKNGDVIAEVKVAKMNNLTSVRLAISGESDIDIDRLEVFKKKHPDQ